MLKLAAAVFRLVLSGGLILAALLFGVYPVADTLQVYRRTDIASRMRSRHIEGDDSAGELAELSGDCVGWVLVEGTGIDYPVMQGQTNWEYLSKDPYGEYSLAGSIFLDVSNAPDFSDGYSLLYGHHMENGSMFGRLDSFRKEAYFRSHRDGMLTAGEDERKITAFAVLEAKATGVLFKLPCDKEAVLDECRENAIFFDEQAADGAGHILAMSTCVDTVTDRRTVVLFGFK